MDWKGHLLKAYLKLCQAVFIVISLLHTRMKKKHEYAEPRLQASLQVDVSEWQCVLCITLYNAGHITVINLISLLLDYEQTGNNVAASQSRTAAFRKSASLQAL